MCNLSATCFAQDPRLFENDWYLQKLTIAEVDHIAPMNDEVTFVPFNIYEDFFDTVICEGLSGHELTISNTEINVFEFVILPDNPCNLPENNVYEDLYYNDFFEWQFLDKTFSYFIENEDNFLSLILTNEDGNKAYYGNEPLAIQDNKISQFLIYPNPAKDKLILNSKVGTGNLKTVIYTIEGKIISTQNLSFERQTSIDISNLSKGIYFMNLETEGGKIQTKKFIKE